MSARPYLRTTIVELEDLFAAKRTEIDTLNALKTELQFRNVPRAAALLLKVKAALMGDSPPISSTQAGLFPADPQPVPSPPQQLSSEPDFGLGEYCYRLKRLLEGAC